MKKLAHALLVTFVLALLSACGATATVEQNSLTRPSAADNSSQEQVAPEKRIQSSPSLADGDIYLEALTKKDAQLCLKIGSTQLREKCVSDLK